MGDQMAAFNPELVALAAANPHHPHFHQHAAAAAAAAHAQQSAAGGMPMDMKSMGFIGASKANMQGLANFNEMDVMKYLQSNQHLLGGNKEAENGKMSPAKATENALKRQLPMQINPLQSYQDQLASMGPNAKRPMVSGTSTYVVPASSHCITLPQMANGQPTTMNIPMMSIPTAFLQQPQQQSTIAASHAAAVAAQNGGLSTSTVSTSAPQMAGSYALSGASPGSVPGMPVLNGMASFKFV
jgi:hypothetical protein